MCGSGVEDLQRLREVGLGKLASTETPASERDRVGLARIPGRLHLSMTDSSTVRSPRLVTLTHFTPS